MCRQSQCSTPEFYVFDADLKLTYHGQFDDARSNNGKAVTGAIGVPVSWSIRYLLPLAGGLSRVGLVEWCVQAIAMQQFDDARQATLLLLFVPNLLITTYWSAS
jgi:hypothetical protein